MVTKNKFILVLSIISLIFLIGLISALTNILNTSDLFNEGTYNYTFYNSSGFVQLNLSNLSGDYKSKIFDQSSSWSNLSWTSEVCYQCEIPNNQLIETGDYIYPLNTMGNILLLHFNNNSIYGENGGLIYDFSNNGNNGSINGSSWSNFGKFGGSLDFDGINDYVSIPNSQSINITGTAITVSLWVKWKKIDSFAGLFGKTTSSSWNDGYGMYSHADDGKIYFWVANYGTNVAYKGGHAADNSWHHIAGTYNGSDVRIFVDGAEGTKDTYSGSITATTAPLQLGRLVSDAYNFNGSIDELAIWNRSLSQAEILQIYKRGALKLNLSIRYCDDIICEGENFSSVGINSPQVLNMSNRSYLQYKFDFYSNSSVQTPKIYNVTVNYLNDTTPPAIILNQPSDGTNTSSENLSFEFTAIDDMDTNGINCSLYVDGVMQNSNSSVLNNTQTNLNATIISGGWHYWNVTCFDTASNQNWSSTNGIYLDKYAPIVSSVVYWPNSSEEVDPNQNVSFNVTVIDARVNVSEVIFQYYNGSVWRNSTMSFAGSNVYNATITLDSNEVNYTYNIWTNDSFGNFNSSINQTFASLWDCNWTVLPADLGGTSGWDENKYIGNLTIFNTGDPQYSLSSCSLDFRLTYNLVEGRMYINGNQYKPSNIYTVAAKENTTISINSTFLSELKEETGVITINEVSLRSNTSSRNVSANIISTSGGPYLYQKIESYPSTLYLTNQNFSLLAYLRNLPGDDTINNTAYNVSFNWTLPSGFLIKDGKTNLSYENISNNQKEYNSLNISFNLTNLISLSPGTVSVNLYSYGYNSSGILITHSRNRTLLSDQINITLLCYNISDGIPIASCGSLDGDYVAPESESNTIIITAPGSGGSTGGGGGPVIKNEHEESSQTFELVRGKQQDFELEVTNKFLNKMENVTIGVTGINSKYIEVIPKQIAFIGPREIKKIKIRISAPNYFTEKEYKLSFEINSELVSNETKTRFKETRLVTLVILEESRSEIDLAITSSLEILNKMNESLMNLKEVNVLIEQNNKYYKELNFLGIMNNYQKIKQISDSAFKSKSIIDDLTSRVKNSEENGITITETKKLIYLAEAIYARGDYSLALNRLEEAKLVYALETKGMFNLIYTVKKNPLQSSGVVLFVFAASFGASLVVKRNAYRRKLKKYDKEEKIILGLIKAVQKDCFERKFMSMQEYEEAMNQYEKRLREIIEGRIKIESRIVNLLKLSGNHKALIEERKRLIERMKEVQEEYINKGLIETRIYENMIKSYSTRLTEVEEQIAFFDAKKALRSYKIKEVKKDEKKK
ncbi:MAG: LamG-like jellyroll fold domain-containing protein [Candidatus Pacearchaeota archaeon]